MGLPERKCFITSTLYHFLERELRAALSGTDSGVITAKEFCPNYDASEQGPS